MGVKLIVFPDKPELGFVAISEQSGLYLCSNCNDVLDQDLEISKPLDTLCPSCRAELLFSKMRANKACTGLATPSAMDEGLAQPANQ